MARSSGTLAHILLLTGTAALAACGGGKKPVEKPVEEVADTPAPKPKKETEADREAKRLAKAQEIIPDGSTCLPAALKEPGAPKLELAMIGQDAVVCAIDTDEGRLLGPVGCWSVNVADSTLAYRTPAPLPGRSISVRLDGACARGYCLPEAPEGDLAHMAWSPDGGKVAVLAGEQIHLFAVDGKAHESAFSIRGDKGAVGAPTAIHWADDTLFVEASDGTTAAVWGFKADGTATGAIEPLGGKPGTPASTKGGSFLLLDKNHVAVAEQGFTTVTILETDTGKRAKLVRKVPKAPCKPAEAEAWWKDPAGAPAGKCKDALDRSHGHLVGATAVMGKSIVALLRGPRLGEIGVLDAKTLAEKKVIKLPWCGAEGGEAPAAEGGE